MNPTCMKLQQNLSVQVRLLLLSGSMIVRRLVAE